MIKEEDLDRILSRSKELEESMSTISGDNEEFVKISKEYSWCRQRPKILGIRDIGSNAYEKSTHPSNAL